MDPTSACNMRCKGCWAAEYGHNQNLTFEEMDRVLTEAKELGTHACLFTDSEFAGGCVAGAGTLLPIDQAVKGVETAKKLATRKNPLESEFSGIAEELV